MAIPINSVVQTNVKNAMISAGFDLTKAPLSAEFVDIVVSEILDAIRVATVSTVTTCPAGAGTGAGGIS